MKRMIHSLTAILLSILLLSMPPLAFGQQPFEEMPPRVFDKTPLEENIFLLPNSGLPIVNIHTIGNLSNRQVFPSPDGQQLASLDYSPIGELSGFGTLRIDDRIVQSGRLHNGSRVQVGSGSCARLELGIRGEISLSSGTDISIATQSDIVYAKLNTGSIKVKLPAGISGFVEVANRIVVNRTDSEVNFTVRASGDRVVVEAPEGYVVQDQTISDTDEYEIAFLTSREEKMKPNRSLELQVKVTDKQQRPRPGTTVLFSSRDVSGNVSGSFSQTSAVTDANGIARTSITVGPKNGQALISASIPGTLALATMTIKVQSGVILGFNTMQVVTIAGVAAAAAVGISQGVVNRNSDDKARRAAAGNQIEVLGRD